MLLGETARLQVVDGVFIVASPSNYAAFPSTAALAAKAAVAYFNGRITTRPQTQIPVYVFGTTPSYDQFCLATEGSRCDSPLGFYDPMRKHVVVNAQNGLGSLTHEMMHPLIEADFPGAPDWFDEGVASLYGKAVFPKPGEVHGAINWRLPELQRTLGSTHAAEAWMSNLFGMSTEAFRDGQQGLHYAMARYFCQWLDGQDRLWSFYHAWRTETSTDPTGAISFQKITGQTPQEANATWVAWVRTLGAGT